MDFLILAQFSFYILTCFMSKCKISLRYVGISVNKVQQPQHAPKWPIFIAQTGGDFRISFHGGQSFQKERPFVIGYYKIRCISYACCDWSVTVFIYISCKHGCDVITYSQFYKRIENGCPVFIQPDASTKERVWENLKVYLKGSHKYFQILPNSLECLLQAI